MPYWMGDAMALGCALAWALAVLAFRRLREVDAAALNLFKNSIASVLLLLTMAAAGIHFDLERSATDWACLIVSGVLGLAVADTLFLAGLRRVEASVVALADCAYSPTVLLLSVLFLGEPMRPGLIVGAPLVVIGLGIVAYDPRATAKKVDAGGVMLAIAGVMTTAVAVVIAQPALHRSELIEATAIRLISGSIALFLAQAMLGRGRLAVSMFRPQPTWRFAIPGTLLGTYVAMILWLGGMKYGTASRAALLNQSGAIWVLVLSMLSGEPVPPRRWIGAGLALTGVAIVVAS